MARPAKVSDEMIQAARQIVQEAKTAREIRTGLSVLIPRVCGVTNKEAADVLGLGVATVARMHKKFAIKSAAKKKIKAAGEVADEKRFLRRESWIFLLIGLKRLPLAEYWLCPQSMQRWRSDWAILWPDRRSTESWQGMDGERLNRTHATLSGMSKPKRILKKLCQNAGRKSRPEHFESASEGDVSGRGPIWTTERSSPMLGSCSSSANGGLSFST